MIPENCLFAHPPSHPKKVSICHHHLLIIGELKHWRRRRQQERQNKKKQLVQTGKQQLFLCITLFFFFNFFAVTVQNYYDVKMPIVPSPEREVKDSRHSGMFQSCIRISRCCFRMSRRFFDIFEFFDLFLFLFIILAKVFYRKHQLKAIWAGSFKIRAKIESSVRLTLQTSLVISPV